MRGLRGTAAGLLLWLSGVGKPHTANTKTDVTQL